MCPTCGRRHLLEGRCAVAPEVVHDAEPPPIEARPEADEPDVATAATATDAAPGRDHGSTRRLLESVITYLGLDAASFGDVDDDVRAEAAPATAAPPPLRITRLAAFLGFDLGADDNVGATEVGELVVAMPSTTVIATGDDGEAAARAPDDPPALTTAEDAPRHHWRRTDDDILYRPSRRPRSPRRAWRDRVASRG